jgi:dihydrofolate reductase
MMLNFEQGGNPFAKIKSYIFSNTLAKAYEGTELVSGNIAEQVRTLKSSPGKDIWLFGGASLTTSFINEGLVDEMNLAVHPILLGSGKLLFNNVDGRKHFKLIDSKAYSTGLVMLNYEKISN